MSVVDSTLDKVNGVYFDSVDGDALASAEGEIYALLKKSFMNDKRKDIDADLAARITANRARAEALAWRVHCKALALAYLEGGYLAEDFNALQSFTQEYGELSKQKGYQKTQALLTRVFDATSSVNAVMADAIAQAERVRSYDWQLVTSSVEVCEEVAALFDKKIAACQKMQGQEVFPNGIAFPDVWQDAGERLAEVRDFAQNAVQRLTAKEDEGVLEESAYRIPNAAVYARYELYPVLPSGERTLAGAVVLCSPIEEEVAFFAVKNGGKNLYALEAAVFTGKKQKNVQNIFTLFANRGTDLLLYGLDRYADGNLAEILLAAAAFGKQGRKVFIADFTGTRALYDRAVKELSCVNRSAMDVSYHYLSMPNYGETVDLFTERGMIEGDSDGKIRKAMPFMGFVGLNAVTAAFAAKNDWFAVGQSLSKENAPLALKYLNQLPSQTLLVDSGWGEYALDLVDNDRKPFDYDDLSAVDKRNVKKIMEGRFSVYEKCGCIARYCTLAGDDQSQWQNLSQEEKESRLTYAVQLLYRAMSIPYQPQVEFLDQMGKGGTTAGLCCGGGKLIQLSRKYFKDYDSLLNTLCHECHHSFQHMVIDSAWCEWYREEMGVTLGRRKTWQENNNKYIQPTTSYHAYQMQVMECEARAFADDCVRDSAKVWHTINFD